MDIRFPYAQARRGQLELAESIARIVREGGSIIVKAPAGYGKTVSVIYGLLLGEVEKAIYTVRTVNETEPVLRELKRFNIPHSILISARRTCPIMARPGSPLLSHEDFWRNCAILRIKGLCKYYQRVGEKIKEIAGYTMGYPVPRAIKLLRDLGHYYEVCPFFSMIELMERARIVIVTYPYVFRGDIANEVFGEGMRDYVLVVDEAHSLLNAQSIVERRVTLGDLVRAAAEIRRYNPENSKLADILEVVRGEVEGLRRFKWGGLKSVDKNVVLEKIEDITLLELVERRIRDNLMIQALLTQSNPNVTLALSKVVDWISSLTSQDYYLFAEVEGEELVLISTPLDPMVVVKRPLESAKSLVLLSGTIPQGDFLRGFLGVERSYTYYDVEMLFGPLMPRSNMYTIVVADVTSRFRERSLTMYDRIARYISIISRDFDGVKLAVYPSYEMMRGIIERLPGDVNYIVEEPHTNLGDIEARIVEGGDILVNGVAGGKLVEGIEFADYEGNNLLHVVAIVGIPFPQPDDYTRMKLETLARRMNKSEANKLVYPITAIIKVRQALGRAIRAPEDKAVFVLLDYRYLRKDIKELLAIKYDRVATGLEDFKKAVEYARRHLKEPTPNA